MREWHHDLSATRAALTPCKWACLFVPRLIFLPAWWPASSGIWLYFSLIFVGHSLINAPTEARRFLIGHEYGHIYCGHVWLHYWYWIAMLGILIGMLSGCMGVLLVCTLLAWLILLVAVWPNACKRRECDADAIAVKAWGPHCALDGALWFMGQRRTTRNHLRAFRLAKLQSYLSARPKHTCTEE